MGKLHPLEQLLGHPAIWRGRSTAPTDTLSTGFSTLDAGLPGGGWPCTGLIEILTPRTGLGELRLLVPLLALALALLLVLRLALASMRSRPARVGASR